MILNLDCRHGLAMLPDNSVSAIVTDAPYELSNDGKQSAAWVFSKFVLPKNAKIKPEGTSGDALATLITEVFCLGGVGVVPSPTTAVPVGSMAFNNQTPFGQHNVENSPERSVDVSQNCAGGDIEPETFKHLGCFALELADPAEFVEILNQLGTGFITGSVGVGFGEFATRVPCLEQRRPSVVSADEDIAFRAYALSHFVSALTGATGFPMFGFNLAGGSRETFTANGARLFFAIILASGAKFIRTSAGTGCLPSMLEASRICVVDDAAHGAFSFDLVVHPQSIRGVGFMGKEWDGSKIAYDVGVWREALRVLKPGGHMLAFSGSRTYHRMAVAIEDAGFEIRDQIMWVYGSGYPKHRSSLKPAHEPIVLARKPAERATLLNIDACRVATDERIPAHFGTNGAEGHTMGRRAEYVPGSSGTVFNDAGRYPANLIHDGSPEVLALFPDSAGSGGSVPNVKISGYGDGVVGTGSAEYLGGERTKVDCGSGSAARFFQTCQSVYNDDLWQDLNLPSEHASIADWNLLQQRQVAFIALEAVVKKALPAELSWDVLLSVQPSTSATPTQLRLLNDTLTQTIRTIGVEFWLESEPANITLLLNRVQSVVARGPTGITTITTSPWISDGYVDSVTFSITPTSLAVGAKDCEQSTAVDLSRFKYCAKASKRDRNEGLEAFPDIIRQTVATSGLSKHSDGSPRNMSPEAKNPHPTVKPTELMRYLCRLVTPPGGLIVDPFAGSGSTGKAAILEGFQFIGFELDPQYTAIANARLEAARNAT